MKGWIVAGVLYILGALMIAVFMWSPGDPIFGSIVAAAFWPAIILSALIQFVLSNIF